VPQNQTFTEAIPADYNAFIYMIDGELEIIGETGITAVASDFLAILGNGERICAKAQTEARFLLVAGQPLNEPVARYGPFVMNTEDEIRQAIVDHRDGKFG
jgi:redox-sensitive bicupin YhaK (pirin superfamily)